MHRKKILSAAFILMFLLVSFRLSAEESKSNPVAVSPGSDTEVVSVWQSCPTFSWSAVDQASSYRIEVFEVIDPKVMEYEDVSVMTSPVISKDIPGPALSWTLSSEQSLKTGSMYTWYVQALDAYGNALGGWSKGRIFKVKQEVMVVGIKEKLGEILNSYGLSEEVINGVLNDMDGDLKEVVVREAGSTIAAQYSDNRSGIQGTEGPTNTFYGLNAGDSITTGKYNSFFGREAGEFTTSGELNTFLGCAAGVYNTTGSKNTFVGSNAGVYNTSGYENTFLGYTAGYNNTTGYHNTYLGSQVGLSNTTGYENTFLGYVAGYNNTTGYHNTFLGSTAGFFNTTGSCNTFIGAQTGTYNTTGFANTFTGRDAGNSNTTGYENTFLGYRAGKSNTTGLQNIFLGSYAGEILSRVVYEKNKFFSNEFRDACLTVATP